MIRSLAWEKQQRDKALQHVGVTIRKVGMGDGIQFTSLFENYYRATGYRLIDLSEPWYLDFNPYVRRKEPPDRTVELWNYPRRYDWPKLKNGNPVYLSNAEIHASVLGIEHPKLTRPRFYCFEDPIPFQKRTKILFHPFGKSHGALPDSVIAHVLKKYGPTQQLYQIGMPEDPDLGIPRISTPTLWDLVREISQARMLIGVDSGPAWIAAAYPDVQIKKIRTRFQFGFCEPQDWVPLDVRNEHSFWDDLRLFQIYNCFEEDCGFTQSYHAL